MASCLDFNTYSKATLYVMSCLKPVVFLFIFMLCNHCFAQTTNAVGIHGAFSMAQLTGHPYLSFRHECLELRVEPCARP